jgi:hypothetical protein
MEFESEIVPSGNPDSSQKQHALGIAAGRATLYFGRVSRWFQN